MKSTKEVHYKIQYKDVYGGWHELTASELRPKTLKQARKMVQKELHNGPRIVRVTTKTKVVT